MSTTSRESGGQQRTVNLSIGGMACVNRMARVEKKLNKLDGVSASVNLATESARITALSAVDADDLLVTVARAGYTGALLDTASLEESSASEALPTGESASAASAAPASGLFGPGSDGGRRRAKDAGDRTTLSMATAAPTTRPGAPAGANSTNGTTGTSPRSASGSGAEFLGASRMERAADPQLRLIYCLVLPIPIMATPMVPALQLPGWQWTVALMALSAAVWGVWPFHKAAFRALCHGAFTMDTLVSLGAIAATGWSLWVLVLGGAGHIGMRMSMELLPRPQGHAAHMYFESAAWVTTSLLAGRYAETRAKYRSGDALCALLELGAKEVTRVVLTSPSGSRDAVDVLDEDGSPRAEATHTEERISVEDLAAGDLFLVRPGEKVAVDGVVVEGRSAVDASLLAGESMPTEVETEQAATGATVNTSGVLLARATAVGEGTTLARIGRMMTTAQAGEAPVRRLADRISGVSVPIVLVLPVATLAGWLLTGHSPQTALIAAVAVLVIACPCAPGLATPMALLVSSGRAVQLGVVIKGPEALGSTRALDAMVMDKTGTVTQGRMSLEVEAYQEVGAGVGTSADAAASPAPLGDETLRLVGMVRSASEHPVTTAITAAARERLGDLPTPTDFSNHEGRGVSAAVEGRRTAVGRPGWLAGKMGAGVLEVVRSAVGRVQDSGVIAVVLAVGKSGRTANVEIEAPNETAANNTVDASDDTGAATPDTQPLKAMAVLVMRSTVWPFSREAAAAPRELGIRPVLLTGDNTWAAEYVATQVGINAADVRTGVLPADKRDIVADLQAQGVVVDMVGDGVNDAAALVQASTQGLSLAMGSGADVVIEAADVTLVHTDLDAAVATVRMSQTTPRIIRQNLLWALAYNVAAIPLAAAGLLNPMIAGATMATSSVIVITSSLHLRCAG